MDFATLRRGGPAELAAGVAVPACYNSSSNNNSVNREIDVKIRLLVLVLLAVLVSLGFVVAGESKSLYRNSTFGFSIEPPELRGAKPAVSETVAMFCLPPQAGFAPNLTIVVQRWKQGLDAYADLSETQFEEMGIAVTATKRLKVGGKDAVEWQYEGKQQGRTLRFLCRAVERSPDEILLITFTCVKASAARYEKVFRQSLESLNLLDQAESGGGSDAKD